MSSLLMSAIRRSGALHFWQAISNPKVRRKSSDQEIYLEVFLGLSCAGDAGSTGEGTTSLFVAGLTEKVCEASPQDSARHESVQLVGHEAGQCPAIGLVGPLLLEGQQMFLHDPVQGSLLRLPA